MRIPTVVEYGTTGFPPEVSRRLQILNAMAYCAGLMTLGFAVSDLFFPRLLPLAAINAAVAMLLFAVPLMHRFGEPAGVLYYAAVAYPAVFVICSILGTASGMQMQYLALTAGITLVLGPDRTGLACCFGTVGVLLILTLEIFGTVDTGLLGPSLMLGNFVACVVGTSAILMAIVVYAVLAASRAESSARREHERSETLLANMMPLPVAERLKSAPGIIAEGYDDASILFADMAGFTSRTSGMPPLEVIRYLDATFSAFDELVERHGLEKIKTTGDGYMVISGVPVVRSDHLEALAEFALQMLAVAERSDASSGEAVAIRIGIHCGPVVAGVVGRRKFFYDVWGDAVNVASRMESTGVSGRIQVTDEVRVRLAKQFLLEPRGTIDVKGKGPMATHFLVGR